MKNNNIGIYIHIPFCRRKCVYCDFYSLPLSAPSDVSDSYISAVITELRASSLSLDGRVVDTVYFGGGTPSLLSPTQLNTILNAVRDTATLTPTAEISMEANPDSVTLDKLCGYKASGINRISFGIQSSCDSELTALSRLHDFETAKAAVLSAKTAGFTNISADLMIGTPYQTTSGLIATIDELAKLPLTHISAYILKVEKGTPLYTSSLLQSCMTEEESADCYLVAINRLASHGFKQYEISNFCKTSNTESTNSADYTIGTGDTINTSNKSYESWHNMKYWLCDEYLGFGPSAHSFLDNVRFANPSSLAEYLSGSSKNRIITDANSGGIDEQIMLGLRLTQGVSLSLIEEAWRKNENLLSRLSSLLDRLTTDGLVSIFDNRVACTAKGFLVSNAIIGALLGM